MSIFVSDQQERSDKIVLESCAMYENKRHRENQQGDGVALGEAGFRTEEGDWEQVVWSGFCPRFDGGDWLVENCSGRKVMRAFEEVAFKEVHG